MYANSKRGKFKKRHFRRTARNDPKSPPTGRQVSILSWSYIGQPRTWNVINRNVKVTGRYSLKARTLVGRVWKPDSPCTHSTLF